jgi:hypothetical protein
VTRSWLLVVLVAALLLGGSLAGASGAFAEPAAEGAAIADSIAARDSTASAPPADRVTVYYFHRTARCENCLKFEAYADQALRDSFGKELAEGTLEWRVVNLDDTTNAHFVSDYDLFESSLVVSRVRGGQEVDWRKLDAMWTLVDDKDAFLKYVAFEVGEELKRLNEPEPQDSDPVPVHRQRVPEPDGGGVGASSQG